MRNCGEIEDEHDKDDDFNFKNQSNTFEAKAEMTIDEFNKETKFNISIDEDTLGGYIFSKINRVPFTGEVINIDNPFNLR